ncbi:MAG: ATP-dependent RNA helicase RhlE [Polaribacter sp.]|jgi:ATP-dependent RNA helicase RhlE
MTTKMTIFAELGLNKTIQANIKKLGYKTPTEIQEQSIGAVLSRADTYAIAPTGTGKTAAYLLPILQELSREDHSEDLVRPIRGLILVPTRELAQQVEQSISVYGKDLKLRTIALFGGIRIESQTKRFKRGADIIVSTPKRLIDLMKAKAFSLENIQHFVMDEADRLVSMGIQPLLNKILEAVPKKKQMVLFSATDSKALTLFSKEHLKNQKFVKTEQNQPALEKIVHTMYRSSARDKTKNLCELLLLLNCERALIFVRTKIGVNLLTERLQEKGYSCKGIHNEIPQKKRLERLTEFKNKEFKFLIATDIASRGLDIDDLYYVINYDLPVNSNDYIHRVGRTARTGSTSKLASKEVARQSSGKVKSRASQRNIQSQKADASSTKKAKIVNVLGHAFSLVTPEQERLVEKISKAVGKEITLVRMPVLRKN